MVRGVPCMCMATQPAPAAAATGHRLADTSFTIVAPAASAASATGGFTVSTDSRTRPASAWSTGTTRRSSSAAGTPWAPGRLDSPPTSMRSAPSSTMARPRCTARSWSKYRPPSENESGVTFKMPMT